MYLLINKFNDSISISSIIIIELNWNITTKSILHFSMDKLKEEIDIYGHDTTIKMRNRKYKNYGTNLFDFNKKVVIILFQC